MEWLLILFGIGAVLLLAILYRYFTGRHVSKLLTFLFVIYALILGVMGIVLLGDYEPTQWRYDVGLILVDNFVGSIVFGLIIMVLNELKDSFL